LPSKKKEILKEKTSEENNDEVENPPYEIPEHWKWVRLRSILPPMESVNPQSFKEKTFTYIDIEAVDKSIQEITNPKLLPSQNAPSRAKRKINEGDILISLVRPNLKNLAVVKLKNNNLVASTGFYVCRKGENYLTDYLFNYLNTIFFTNYLISKTKGHKAPSVRSDDFTNGVFPLPPLEEQKRIVARLDSMLGKLKEAKKLLEEARETFKDRRNAILAKAFCGELTAKWREENPGVESAEVLLEKIAKERFENSKTESETKKLEAIYNYKEVNKFKKLPTTWKVSALSKICYSFEYGTSAKSLKQGKYVVIRMGNLQQGKIIWDDLAYTNDASEIQKYKLEYNDILFNRTNSAALVGKTSIYKGELPAVFAGYLVRINYHKNINPDYINFALNSNFAKHWCNEVKTDAVNQSNINATKLSFFELPLPPLEEQKEIVRQIESLFAKEDEAKEILDMEEQIELLEKAILAKAFRGELG